MINERLTVRITNANKDLYISDIQKVEPESKDYQITLSERKSDAIHIEEKEELNVINRMFNVNASYIRTTTVESDISNLIWGQLNNHR